MSSQSSAANSPSAITFPNFTDTNLVYTKETAIGRGLFARQALPADCMVGALSAGITTMLPIKADGSVEYPSATIGQCIDIIVRDGKLITLLKPAGVVYDGVDMINHSCTPNCTILGKLAVVTLRAIAADEELTCHYIESGITIVPEGIHCQCRPGCQTIL